MSNVSTTCRGLGSNVPRNNDSVKHKLQINYHFSAVFSLALLLTGIPVDSRGETAKEQAIQNSAYLTTMLHGVAAPLVPNMVQKIANGTIERPAPKMPIWIINSETGLILYYQGQSSFKDQPAANLVDDKGIRFGVKAIDRARAAKNGWIKMTLGGTAYSAYCQAKVPFVVCTLPS